MTIDSSNAVLPSPAVDELKLTRPNDDRLVRSSGHRTSARLRACVRIESDGWRDVWQGKLIADMKERIPAV